MQIDGHQHFWRYNLREYGWIDDSMASIRHDFLPEDLKPLLDMNGFQGSVAVQVRQTMEETEWLLRLAEQHPFIVGVVGWVDLCSPNLRQSLKVLAGKTKLIGVRHIVQSEPDGFLLRSDFLKGISALEEFDLAYDLLIYPKHLTTAIEFVKRFPTQRFVLDHLAKPDIKRREIDKWTREIRELASFPNVYAKLSGLMTEADWQAWKAEDFRSYLDVAFDCFGTRRLIIGSDWPVCTVAASYESVMDLIKSYLRRYPPEERSAVLGDNAARFWKLQV
jgi:L-fuconolactonase